ncbi:23513_t:CDS:2 [Cetraspora pellucida]|uniref:23513_t:CDS:1 n=1 Tax=Cetraspora pellucida TaxID=1433469 RepID=A0A9N9DES5_9GLOM|nr:23513_t:CDS:2 [Cetraspora pellucida]
MHLVIFNPTNNTLAILAQANYQKTTLTAFFKTYATLESACLQLGNYTLLDS